MSRLRHPHPRAGIRHPNCSEFTNCPEPTTAVGRLIGNHEPCGATMPPDPDKRQLRKLKQVLKKRGTKHRRAELKRTLAENPEEAADTEENLGRYRSDTLNGLDRDSTRRRDE